MKDIYGKNINNNDVLKNKNGDIIIVSTNDYLIMKILQNMDVEVIGNLSELNSIYRGDLTPLIKPQR